MAHFAQVIDNTVRRVIVVDEEHLPGLKQVYPEGIWLKASYNTRDGVHYGDDGLPDGGEALRMNYPQEGYHYDAQMDAFYRKQEKPADAMYFDKKTMGYKLPLPNKARDQAKGRPSKVSKVYVTNQGKNSLGPLTMDNLSAALNIEWVSDPAVAEMSFPVTDQETRMFALRPEFRGIRGMTSRAMWNVTDRLRQAPSGLTVLPTWQARTKEEVLALPNAPFFVKRQRTHAKDDSVYAYTTWANPQAFVDAADESFWQNQSDPTSLYGEFVFQPVLGHPFTALDLRVVVNDQSETYFMAASLMTYDDVNELGRMIPFTGDCEKQKAEITKVVKEQGLKRGIHMLQYCRYNDDWALMDWNSRLSPIHLSLFPAVYPVLDDAFRHMLGLPVQGDADGLYYEQRSYRDKNVGREVETLVGDCGLFARWEGDKLARVAAIGPTKREVSARYDELDRQLLQLNAS